MAEYNLGRVAFLDRGVYSALTSYNKWDFVTTVDSCYLYINTEPSIGIAITNTLYWKCIADGKPSTLAAAAAAAVTEQSEQFAIAAGEYASTTLGLKNDVTGMYNTVVEDTATVVAAKNIVVDDAAQTALDRIATGQDAQTTHDDAAQVAQDKNYTSGYMDRAETAATASETAQGITQAAEAQTLLYRDAAAAIIAAELFVYAGNKVALASPYITKASVYKGQVHCHTTNSDGLNTPTALVGAYKAAGYDFIAITDHNVYTPDPNVSGITFLGGVEYTGINGYVGDVGAIGATQSNTNHGDPQDMVDEILADGAIPNMCHPNFYTDHWSDIDLEKTIGYQAIEVFNPYAMDVVATESKINTVLSKGIKTNILSVDDCHNIGDAAKFNVGWIKVFSDSNTVPEIKEQIRNGNYYSSTGLDFTSILLAGKTISVTTPSSCTINFIGKGGVVLQSSVGASADYDIIGDEVYVYIKLTSGATYAWSNPIYVNAAPAENVSRNRGVAYSKEINTESITTTDILGKDAQTVVNLIDLVELSKDNVIEFKKKVGIGALFHTINQEMTDIVDIPINSDSVIGTAHGIGITIAGVRVFKVVGFSDGAGGLSSSRIEINGQPPISGTKIYYVSDTSGGTVNRKLTFKDGLLISED